MDCFIKKIFSESVDEQVHKQFVRFGKGEYRSRAVLSANRTSKVKLNGSFEYANDFVVFASDFPVKFSGIILSREKLDLENEKFKFGLYSYEVSNLLGKKIKEIEDKVYVMLLDGEGEGVNLKIKKKLPKPGKSEKTKMDEKFCIIEADLNLYGKIKDAFFWDIADFKKAKVSHDYIINELIMPSGEKDFELVRIKARRKGKIIRKIKVDGKEEIKEREFDV